MKSWEREINRLIKKVEKQRQLKVTLPNDPTEFAMEVLKFNPLPYQEALLHDASDRIAVRFCRQSGKSTTLAAKGIVYACLNPNTTVLIVAPGLRQSMLLMDKIHDHISKMEPEIKQHLIYSMQRTTVRFQNRSRIIALPCAENLIRGLTAHLILADEAAFFGRDEYMFSNVLMPMLATTKGGLIVSSTPWSTKSMFYEFCKGKLSNRFSQHYANWREAVESGLIDRKFIEDMQASLLPEQFTMEFEAEFTEDADTWLQQDLLVRCIDSELEYYSFESKQQGIFYVGVDFGKHDDHSVVAVIESKEQTLRLIHVHRFPLGTAYASVIGYVKALSDRWKAIHSVNADVTGVGDYIVEDMIRSGLANTRGVKFTVESKENMASVLKDRATRGSLKIPYDRELINELNVERFALLKTGHIIFSHPEGTHDDRFWAVALAVWGGRIPMSKPLVSFGEVTEK